MAIRFEQPAPFDAEAIARFTRNRLGGGGGGGGGGGDFADFARSAAAVGAQRAEAGNMQFQAEFARDRMDEQRRQFYAEQQNQFTMVDKRAQAAAWLNQQDMTYAEQLRLEKLQGEVGAIEADPTLARFEKDELILQKRTGIDMGRKRLDATRAKQEEALATQQLAQAERTTKIMDMQGKFLNKTLPERTQKLPDGGGWLVETQPGRWEHIAPPKSEGVKDQLGRSPADWVKAMRDAQVRADKWISEQKKIARDAGLPEPDINRADVISQDMKEQGFNPDLNQHFGGEAGGTTGGQKNAEDAERDQQIMRQNRTKAIEAMNEQAGGLSEGERANLQGLLGRARGLMESGLTPETEPEYLAALAEVARAIQKAKEKPEKPKEVRNSDLDRGFMSLSS